MASKLALDVIVNTKGLDKLQGLGGSLQRTGVNLTKFVTLPLLGAGAASLALAADAEKSAAKLTAAFKNMGDKSGKSLAELEQQAIDLGQATTFDDEAIMEAQAALITFGAVSGDAFDRAIQGAADYAAATGKDLTEATNVLGKALADPVAGLSRLTRAGVVFTEQQKAQVEALVASGDTLGAQNVILAAFEQRYAGVNAELRSTAAGEAAQAFEDLQNAGEEIGAIFLPMLAGLARGLASVARWFTDLPAPMQTTIVAIAGVAAAIGPLLFLGGKLISSFKAISTAFTVLKVLMLTNPFVALAAAVIAIAALIILNWDKIVEFLRKAWNLIMGGVLSFADRLRSVWETITGAVSTAWNGIINIIKGVINGIITAINAFIGFINGIQIHIPAIGVGPFQTPAFDWWGLGIPTIPMLAEGGIITAPTLALLGERGPEAVVPLDKGLGETHFHSHIEVRGEDPFIRNEEDLVRTNQRIAFLAGF